MSSILRQMRALQVTIGVLSLVPLSAGLCGVLAGPGDLHLIALDSQYRYLSGLLFAIGLSFCATIPGILQKGPQFRALGFLVIIGGLARLYGVLTHGLPGSAHCAALALELGAVPGLMLWQDRLSRVR